MFYSIEHLFVVLKLDTNSEEKLREPRIMMVSSNPVDRGQFGNR